MFRSGKWSQTLPTLSEELKGGQKKLDVDGDGEIESSDLKKLRNKKMNEKSCGCEEPCDCDSMDESADVSLLLAITESIEDIEEETGIELTSEEVSFIIEMAKKKMKSVEKDQDMDDEELEEAVVCAPGNSMKAKEFSYDSIKTPKGSEKNPKMKDYESAPSKSAMAVKNPKSIKENFDAFSQNDSLTNAAMQILTGEYK